MESGRGETGGRAHREIVRAYIAREVASQQRSNAATRPFVGGRTIVPSRVELNKEWTMISPKLPQISCSSFLHNIGESATKGKPEWLSGLSGPRQAGKAGKAGNQPRQPLAFTMYSPLASGRYLST